MKKLLLLFFAVLVPSILAGCTTTDYPSTPTDLGASANSAIVEESNIPAASPDYKVEERVVSTPADKKVTPAMDNYDPEPVDVPLSNNDTYVNVDGNEVHSPAHAPSVPVGASAVCGDGTYSFSQHRRGTCSHHGGVSEWLN